MNKRNIAGQLCLVETNKDMSIEKTYHDILKERVEEYGVDSLIDAEILSLLTGISVDITKKAIEDFGLPELVKYLNSLNLTKVQRRKLELLNLYHKRLLTSYHKEKPVLNSSFKAGEYAISLFIGKSYECFFILCLDAQNRLNYAALVHEGTINEAPVYPRLIVETALSYRANSIILCHNHPGGSRQASSADIEATKRILLAMKSIGIGVMDHLIIADGGYVSFAESGLMPTV